MTGVTSPRSFGLALEPLVLVLVSACGMTPEPTTPTPAVELPETYRMLFVASTWRFSGEAVTELVNAPSCEEDRAACEARGGSCPSAKEDGEDHAATGDAGDPGDAEGEPACAATIQVEIVCSSRDVRVVRGAMLAELSCESEDVVAHLLPNAHLLGTPTGLYNADGREDPTATSDDWLWMRARPEPLERSWSAQPSEEPQSGTFRVKPDGAGWSVEDSRFGPGRISDGWELYYRTDVGITGGHGWSFTHGAERVGVSWGDVPAA